MASPPRSAERPVASVIICSYNGRNRIDGALRSLARQDIREAFETVVVASGQDGCEEHLRRTSPHVVVVGSGVRLGPGAARNRGVEASSGRFIAFLPDDGEARPGWLRSRVDKHRLGYPVVGGAISNATPWHPVAAAGYLIEYVGVLPHEALLPRQAIPHSLGYEREVFERFGPYPEEVAAGEDTVFNRRLVEARLRIGFEPEAVIAVRNATRVGAFLLHQYGHGRGLVQSVAGHGLSSPTGPIDQPRSAAAYRILLRYPVKRWGGNLLRLADAGPGWVAVYLGLSPLVWAGLWAGAAGAWTAWNEAHRRITSPSPHGRG